MLIMRAFATLAVAAGILVLTPVPSEGGITPAGVAHQPPSQADNRYCGKGDVPHFGGKDGSAEPPRTCFYTGLDGTPSPNHPRNVPASASLQSELDNAKCGDVLMLEVGATFSFSRLPAKHCDDAHWITVRTAASDQSLPPEGTRLTPCYAGVASLPGRPAYACSTPKNVMARIEVRPRQSTPMFSGDHYRFIGIEFTRRAGGWVNALADAKGGGKIVFDRTWFHGNSNEETTRGIQLSGSTSVAIIDSYFSDFHCMAGTGDCTDSQAIAGGHGQLPCGTWKIVNNFLESAAENILFGGAGSSVVPSDIEIRRNHLFKPLLWNPADPSFFGTKFIVKNSFEIKNATRVLFEGNVMQNVWGGFSQAGAHIVLTPKNPGNIGVGSCTVCEVSDVTIRYSLAMHGGQEIQIANIRSSNGGFAKAGRNYSIHDVIFEDQQYGATCYKCGNFMNALLSAMNDPPSELALHDVSIDHITIFATEQPNGVLSIGGPTPAAISNIAITNSILPVGKYGIWSTGGGKDNCASQASANSPKGKFDACWKSYVFRRNVLIAADSVKGQTPSWPADNFIAPDVKSVFDSGDPSGTKPRISLSTKFRRRGTDGKDPGADVDAVNLAIAGIQ